MIVLNLSRPNHCPRFVETKSLSSIYREQIIIVDLLSPNHFFRFIETKSLSSSYRRQDDCPRQHEYLQLIKTVSVSRTAERICEARGKFVRVPLHYFKKRLKTSAQYCKALKKPPNGSLNVLHSPQSCWILGYLSNWGTLGGWSPPPASHSQSPWVYPRLIEIIWKPSDESTRLSY